jgi:NADPH:quinone reductase-like Zn-dependent oxidoreductase
MQAVLCTKYGPPEGLQISEVDRPIPKHGEVLIKVHATTVSSADWRVSSLNVPTGFRLMMRLALGWAGPRQPILGSEFAGVVYALGEDAGRFKLGDAVFGFRDAKMGCHAQYVCIAQDGAAALKPPRLSDAQAAALSFGGTTALSFFKRGGLQRGERLLINGASGAVGTAAVQLAKHFGAEITAVCSAANIDLLKSLGANHVIDYTQHDFTKNGQTYDLIMDTVGNAPYSRSKASLTKRGRLLMVLAGLPSMLQIPWVELTTSRKLIAGPATGSADDIRLLADLAQRGHFTLVIDRIFGLPQIADAYRYVATGRKRGNVVIQVAGKDGLDRESPD